MILEVARDLDDSGLKLPRCGYSCLELLRIKRRRLRDARACAEQQREKHCATAQTRPDDVVGPPISSNLPPVCHGSHALLSPPHIEIHLPSLGRRDCRTPPDLDINAKIVNRPDYFEDAEDGLCFVCDRL